MSLSHRYRQLATLIESLEADGITVEEAEPIDGDGERSPADGFRVRLALELPADATVGGLGTDSTDAEWKPSVSVRPVGTNVSTSDQPTASEGGQSGAVVADTTQPRDGTSTTVGEGADAVRGGAPTETGSPEGDGAPTDATVVETEDHPADTESAAVDSTTGGATDQNQDTATDQNQDTARSDDEAVACTHPDCDRTFDTERGMKIHRTKAHPLSELVDGEHDRTVHHDPSVLARVYDEHDTFVEMTKALDVDVGAQAVRKQMIRHGIHQPGAGSSTDDAAPAEDDVDDVDDEKRDDPEALDETDGHTDATTAEPDETAEDDGTAEHDETAAVDATSTHTAADGPYGSSEKSSRDAETTPDEHAAETADERDTDSHATADAPSDGSMVSERLPSLDLPGSLSTGELQTAVEEATTLYDVQRSLDLDRETTRDVLAEYDLLELVSGRATALRDREDLKTEITQRIRRRAT